MPLKQLSADSARMRNVAFQGRPDLVNVLNLETMNPCSGSSLVPQVTRGNFHAAQRMIPNKMLRPQQRRRPQTFPRVVDNVLMRRQGLEGDLQPVGQRQSEQPKSLMS